MKLPDDVEDGLAETLRDVNARFAEHDRNSCNDENLHNCGTIFLPPRCQRCEALEKLRVCRIEYEYEALKAQLASA